VHGLKPLDDMMWYGLGLVLLLGLIDGDIIEIDSGVSFTE
jgi:hypothetical protein